MGAGHGVETGERQMTSVPAELEVPSRAPKSRADMGIDDEAETH
jgi:hypothetical protein